MATAATEYSLIELKAKILTEHSIVHHQDGARLMALDVMYDRRGHDCSYWVDVTGWSVSKLLGWLGY